MESEEFGRSTALGLLERLASREVTAEDLARAALERIDGLDASVNAFRAGDHELTLKAARAADERYRTQQAMGKLDGLPIAVKDAFDMRGWATRNGSKLTSDQSQDQDAPAVASCRRNGFVPVGKTTTPEFGRFGKRA